MDPTLLGTVAELQVKRKIWAQLWRCKKIVFSCFQRHIMTGQMGQSLAFHWSRPLSTVHSESRPKPGPVVQYSRWNANTAVKLHNTKAILASDSIILRLVKAFPTSDFSSHAFPLPYLEVNCWSRTATATELRLKRKMWAHIWRCKKIVVSCVQTIIKAG